MSDYIFDFGALTPETERIYVRAMLQVLSSVANDAHHKTWCCIQRLCINGGEEVYVQRASTDPSSFASHPHA
jgi:hypothetical protein